MKNTKSIIKLTISILSALLILGACSFPSDFAGAAEDGKVTLRVSIKSGAALTVNYTVSEAERYVLYGTLDGGAEQTLGSWTSTTNMSVGISTGSWSFTLTAYDAETNGNAILEETQNVTVESSTSLSFTLEALKDGTGTVDVTLNWPSDVGIDSVTAVYADTDISDDLITTSTSAEYKNTSAASGDYILVFKLYDSNSTFIGSTIEKVRVRNNLTSSKTITLSSEDLNTAPTAPSGITITTANNTSSDTTASITVTWMDNAITETGFIIYRDGVEIATVIGGTTSYTDETAVCGTSYSYSVAAVNSFGSTTAVETSESVTTPYYITFVKNDGSETTVSQEASAGETVTLTNTFSYENHSFCGWSTSASGSVEYENETSYIMGSAKVKLYAIWSHSISVTFITPDGESAVSADSNIIIEFSESLDGSTKGTVSFTSPEVTFTDGDNATITFSTTTNTNDTITINPTENLQQTNYTSISIESFKDDESSYVTYSDSAYYFPVRGAMDLYFPFTDGSLEDASGRGVTLSTSGDPTLTAGHDGSTDGAYRFDGEDDYFQVVGDLGIDCDADFTISSWVYIDEISNFRGILSNYHAIAAEGTMLRVNSSWDGHTNALDLCEGYSNNNVISTGTWIHIVAIYEESTVSGEESDDPGTVQFYVDGADAGGGSTGYNVKNTAYGFTMGADYLCDARYFSGIIDEVRFYKYALTSTEASNLYSYGNIDGE